MNKKLLIVIAFICSICFIWNVNAEGIFKYEFSTSEYPVFFGGYYEVLGTSTTLGTGENKFISFKDGYLAIDVISVNNLPATRLTYYDKKGNVIKKNNLNNYIIVDNYFFEELKISNFLQYNGKIYCMAYDSSFVTPYFLTINSDLEVEAAVKNVVPLAFINEKMYYLNSDEEICENKIDFSKEKKLSFADDFELTEIILSELKKNDDYKWLASMSTKGLKEYYLDEIIDDNNKTLLYNILVGNYELLGINKNYALIASVEDYDKTEIILYDNQGKVVFKKSLKNNSISMNITQANLIHDYIFISSSRRNYSYLSDIDAKVDIYDLNGNLVQTIHDFDELNQMPFAVNETDNGFSILTAVEQGEKGYQCLTNSGYVCNAEGYATYYYVNKVYSFIGAEEFPIVKEIKGKGSIDVPSSYKPNEEVRYTIKPAEGFEFDSISIVDEDGKVIPTKDNKFMMPKGKVTIKVDFVAKKVVNPETGVNNYVVLGMIVVLLSILVYILTRRYNTFGNIR